MSRTTVKLFGGLILFAVSLSASAFETDNDDEWMFAVDLYALGPEIEAETAAGPTIDLPLHKIVKDL